MKRYIWILLVIVGVVACNRHSAYWDSLAEVETYIEARPDSALTVLQQIAPEELTSKEEKAKHALLLSMALDKNYIDTTTFDVLQPAIDYYKNNGTATDKLRTYYYQGRIYQNIQDNSSAMKSFVRALDEGEQSDDLLTKARTYFAQSNIHYQLFDWESFIETNKNAAELFNEAGLSNSYINCLNRIINGYTLSEDKENALKYIEECERLKPQMAPSRLGDFYAAYLTYLINYGSENEISALIQEYKSAIPLSRVDWLTVANAYTTLGKYNDALEAVVQYSDKNIKYYAVISDIYKELGKYKEALESYEKYLAMAQQNEYDAIKQDTRFVEERYQLELSTIKERNAKRQILSVTLASIFILLLIILWTRTRLKISRIEKLRADEEKEKYRLLYLQIEEEKDDLTSLISQNDEMEPEVRKAVITRLDLLNKFFTAYITNSNELDNRASKEVEELLANKDTFMHSTRHAFAVSHPKFISYLEEKGLNEWEINYCCLYAIGLKGKEVGSYIKMRSHYHSSSDIRTKLGISEHDTNLGIYIRKLLKSFE